MILYLVPILTTLTLFATAIAIYQLQTRNRAVTDRLQRVTDPLTMPADEIGVVDSELPWFLRAVGYLAWLMPTQIYSETLKWDLAQTGYRHIDARKVFVGVRVLSTAVFGVATAVVTMSLHLAPNQILIFTVLGVAIGYLAPVMMVRHKQGRRQEEITLALPDALDLLVICVEAGQGLNAALLKVGRESAMHAPDLSDELRTVNNEMRAGMTRTQALRNLSLRTGVDDVRALVAVMIQSDRFGTSIATALRIHADSLRTKRRQRAEETARKAPVKLVFPLVFCIFPELLVVILAPGMLALFRALAKMTEGQ